MAVTVQTICEFVEKNPQWKSDAKFMLTPWSSKPFLMITKDFAFAFANWCVGEGKALPEDAQRVKSVVAEEARRAQGELR